MHATKNDLAMAKRRKISEWLSCLLADAVDLKMQIKQAHWNVRGEGFIALHELFDAAAAEVEGGIDLIAERIAQLGGEAVGSIRVCVKRSRLKDYPLTLGSASQHVDALSTVIAAFNANARVLIDETADVGDAVTADILTGIARGLDKQMWLVEAHLSPKDQEKDLSLMRRRS